MNYSVIGKLETQTPFCNYDIDCKNCQLKKCLVKTDIKIITDRIILNTPESYSIMINPGFEFNGASIPRFFWRVIGHPFQNKFAIAALFHDALYTSHLFDKATSDKIFYELLLWQNNSKWRSKTMYTAVKRFGGNAWKSTRQDIIEARKIIMLVK
jgi:hypothetical protein